MNNIKEALLNLLERVLGKSSRGNHGNYKFVCPFHVSNPPGKKKLEINLENQNWSCWTCKNINKTSGKTIKSLFNKLELPEEYFKELKFIIPNNKTKQVEIQPNQVELPKEFTSILDNIYFESKKTKNLKQIFANKSFNYLKNRGITEQDIKKYNIGYCFEGIYEGRIIIPSYNEKGKLNYFMARDITDSSYQKYKNPVVKNDDIIGMELYINWNLPIVLVEGIFDFLTLKRNCIPLFGKNISEALMKKIVTSKIKKIYIALDKDAIKDSLKYCEELMKMGKEIYLVELDGKDINSIGFNHFLEILEKTPIFTFQKLISKKLLI